MAIDAALSSAEFKELSEFLVSDTCPDSGMVIFTLDGFLASVVLTPVTLMASRWLPWVWDMDEGNEAPNFDSIDQANRILSLIMRHYNSVVTAIDEDRFQPKVIESKQPDGSVIYDARMWCEGFILGIERFDEYWNDVVEKHTVLVEPMMLLGTEVGSEVLQNEYGDEQGITQEIFEAIPNAILALREYFRPQREQQLAEVLRDIDARKTGSPIPMHLPQPQAKVGRNDLCPCGSGKKFKKCCGSGDWLH